MPQPGLYTHERSVRTLVEASFPICCNNCRETTINKTYESIPGRTIALLARRGAGLCLRLTSFGSKAWRASTKRRHHKEEAAGQQLVNELKGTLKARAYLFAVEQLHSKTRNSDKNNLGD
jgi:hypothetical protein